MQHVEADAPRQEDVSGFVREAQITIDDVVTDAGTGLEAIIRGHAALQCSRYASRKAANRAVRSTWSVDPAARMTWTPDPVR